MNRFLEHNPTNQVVGWKHKLKQYKIVKCKWERLNNWVGMDLQ